jgi:hypothetical protein
LKRRIQRREKKPHTERLEDHMEHIVSTTCEPMRKA